MLELRPTTDEDVLYVAKEPMPRTGKAYTVTGNDEPLAIIGYYFESGHVILFSSIDPRAKDHSTWYPWDVVRLAKKIIEEAKELGMPMFAAADPDIPGSEKLLEYLGFTRYQRSTYQWLTR